MKSRRYPSPAPDRGLYRRVGATTSRWSTCSFRTSIVYGSIGLVTLLTVPLFPWSYYIHTTTDLTWLFVYMTVAQLMAMIAVAGLVDSHRRSRNLGSVILFIISIVSWIFFGYMTAHVYWLRQLPPALPDQFYGEYYDWLVWLMRFTFVSHWILLLGTLYWIW